MSNSADAIASTLWNPEVTVATYGSPEQYYAHVFAQYNMAVEMADRVSSRRMLANTFFLSLHTFIITAVGFILQGEFMPDTFERLRPFIFLTLPVAWALCYVWWRLLHAYRQLNAAKFLVIGEYEKRLPSSPLVSAEWQALGSGQNPQLYRSLTDVENYVPRLFALIYLGGVLVASF